MPPFLGAPILPSVTTTQRNALTAVVGMHVYDTTLKCTMEYRGAIWQVVQSYAEKLYASDASYTAGSTDATIYRSYVFTTTLTADRNFFLPTAASVPAGTRITLKDGTGTVSGPAGSGHILYMQPSFGSGDTIEHIAQATNLERIIDPYGLIEVESDGVSNWQIITVLPAVRVEVFATAGSYTYRKPFTCKHVRVIAIGGGAGGGAGAKNPTATASGGGGGGGPGALTDLLIQASDLSATETVVVGAKGSGGTTRNTTGTGATGSNGNPSSMTVAGAVGVYAGGGTGGTGGGQTTGASGTGGVPGVGAQWSADDWHFSGFFLGSYGSGGSGVTGAASAAAAGANGACGGPGQGGGGGAVTSGGTVEAAAAGGNGASGLGVGGIGAAGGIAGSGGSAGGNGTASTAVAAGAFWGGGGGGGGVGRSSAGNGLAGGNGGKFGGGGGGGANGVGATGTNNNGAGGDGADGVVVVISYR